MACRERWEFWKFRFSEIQGQVDEVAKMAQRAVDEMETVEKGIKKRHLDLYTDRASKS